MSELNDMRCAELADVAAELALGVLTGRERAMAVAHLDRCDACREDVRQLMATGEQLLELLPPAEPPAGFETRVLERLGLPVSALDEAQGGAHPQLVSHRAAVSARRPRADQHRADQHGAGQHGADQHGTGQQGAGRPGAPPARPGGTRRPGRTRRALAAAAMVVAVIAAGLGGWRIGLGASPNPEAGLTTASLRSGTGADVGDIYLYSGDSDESRWVYMSVDMETGNEPVTCQLVGQNGRVTTIGTFRLADGYGSWGSPDPGKVGPLRGARLVSASGTVLASAAFTAWLGVSHPAGA